MKLSFQIRRGARRNAEDGYVLLTLLLFVAILVMAFAFGVLPTIKFTMKRDREEEMIHRGTQYSRAIRAYYKALGRYPSKIEDLENTNQRRFLRKRYQDPMNCKAGKCADFKIVHFGEVQLAGSMGMGAPGINGANPVGTNPSGPNGSGTFGNSLGNSNSAFWPNSTFGQNSPAQNGQSNPSSANTSQNPQAASNNSGADPNSANGNGNPGDITSPQDQPPGQPQGQQFGGGAMIGVASLSKDTTIREYNHKKKYNEWLFVFDPSLDRGALITTPYQPMQAAFGMGGTPPNLNQQINGPGASQQQKPGGGYVDTGQPPPGMLNDPDLNRTNPPQ